jgi:hypothetical protein
MLSTEIVAVSAGTHKKYAYTVDKTQIFNAKAGCAYTRTYNTDLKGKYVTLPTYIQNRGGQTKHPVETASVNPIKNSGYQKSPL